LALLGYRQSCSESQDEGRKRNHLTFTTECSLSSNGPHHSDLLLNRDLATEGVQSFDFAAAGINN
jgi:hypothetical protein